MIAGSIAGAFVEQLASTQFSQHEERQADKYGLKFLHEEGYDPAAAASALQKLSKLGGNHPFLSSHPDPLKRIQYLNKNNDNSLLERLFYYGKTLVSDLLKLIFMYFHWVLLFFQ